MLRAADISRCQKRFINCQSTHSGSLAGLLVSRWDLKQPVAPKVGCRAAPNPKNIMMATFAKKQQDRLPRILDHASGDKRFKILEALMKKHQFKQDALIEVLHKAQELFGYLEDDLLLFIAYKLKLPASRVYGVATFYHFFTLKPKGRHTCVVCMGTACYVRGAVKVLATLE